MTFRLVKLPPTAGTCIVCARLLAKVDLAFHEPSHYSWPPSGSTPRLWRVTREEDGAALAVGTTLRLEVVRCQNFCEFGGFSTMDWLFTALDGPQSGSTFFVDTQAWSSDPKWMFPDEAALYPSFLEAVD